MDDNVISLIASESRKVLFDNPSLTYQEAIKKAKELILSDTKVDKMEKTS